MSNDSKRISELSIATTVSANDRVVVLTNPNSSPNVYTISAVNLAKSLVANIFPIANSSSFGVIKIGPGLAIAANGVVTAPLPIANSSSFGVIKVGDNLTINATGYLNGPSSMGTGDWSFNGSRALLGGVSNAYIDGQTPGGIEIYQDYAITLVANNSYWVFNENLSIPANSTIGSEGGFHIENALTITANTISVNAISTNTISANLLTTNNVVIYNNIFDDLLRPLLNSNALDINADGGTSTSVFAIRDEVFTGGGSTTVFGKYEAALDGGVSFNNRHSASYIDGGGANVL